jgi:hypothetical protein
MPRLLTAGNAQRLQRAYGNQAVTRMVAARQSPRPAPHHASAAIQRLYLTRPFAGQPQLREAFGAYPGLMHAIGEYRRNGASGGEGCLGLGRVPDATQSRSR